jgi:hypothetical protein
MSSPELLTERLSLRRPTRDDIPAILAINRDRGVGEHNPADRLTTVEQAVELFGRWDEHWRTHGFGYWVVRLRSGEQVLGFCGLKRMQLDGREVLNLFYRLDPSAWGGSEAHPGGRGRAGKPRQRVRRWDRLQRLARRAALHDRAQLWIGWRRHLQLCRLQARALPGPLEYGPNW